MYAPDAPILLPKFIRLVLVLELLVLELLVLLLLLLLSILSLPLPSFEFILFFLVSFLSPPRLLPINAACITLPPLPRETPQTPQKSW